MYMRALTKDWSNVLLIVSIVALSCVILGSLSYVLFGNWLVESVYSVYREKPIEFLNKPLKYIPFGQSRAIFFRMLLICIAIQLIVAASLLNHKTRCVIKGFFTATTHPINLAIFRFVLFFTMFSSVNISEVVWFSQIPAELRFMPTGLGWLPHYLPINEKWATVSSALFRVFCLMGMIGLFTRVSTLLTLILGFYVLGIPQFFGKVSHYHHLIWFSAVLAVSRCADVFSCDAIFAAWKRADHGITDLPSPSRIYALPLRFVWLLMGIIYFFPGFWKLGWSGLDWGLGENLKFRLYKTWIERGDWDWTPLFRIDRYPLLYKMAGTGVIVFEMSFIFLIFLPRLRILAALGGLAFHNLTNIFMRIPFWWLQTCYVALFDWNAIFSRIGHWLYRKEMYVIYDGNCKVCRRTIASLRVFDVLGRVTYVNAFDNEAMIDHGLHWLDSTTLMTGIHAIVGKESWTGFSAYRLLATRIPILWPILPFLYAWPISKVANRLYRHVADSRTCSIADTPFRKAKEKEYNHQVHARVVVVVSVFLIFVNILCSICHVDSSWPFACYPTFAQIIGPKTEIGSLEMSMLSSRGKAIHLDKQTLKQKFHSSRWVGLIQHILSTDNPEQMRVRLKALWELWVQNDPSLRLAGSVRFYRVVLLPTPPEQRGINPVRRELLSELKFK